MSGELETLGAASSGAIIDRQTADLTGDPCRNCGAVVEGRYCPSCGQLAASFHRPVWSLFGETIADSLALDGRLARTLPLLLLRPWRLTKNYTSGKRARYVPPFRMLLLSSLLFYFTLFAFIGKTELWDNLRLNFATSVAEEAQANPESGDDLSEIIRSDGTIDRDRAHELMDEGIDPTQAAVIERGFDTFEDPRLFIAGLERWAPRLSLLLIPITILVIALMHFWRRRLFIYDHAIHALHLHAWLFLTGTLMMVAIPYAGAWLAWAYFAYVAFYIGRSFQVVGETNIVMAGLRTFILLLNWVISIIVLTVCAMILSGMDV